MISLHLGMPRIGFKNLNFIGQTVLMSAPGSTIISSADYFRKHLRPFINSRRVREVRSSLEFITSSDKIVHAIDAPFLLGAPEDLLMNPRARKRAATRLLNVSRIFTGQSIQLHLMIVNPLAYIFRILGEDALDLVRGADPMSWASFVEELGFPELNHQLTVWDCGDSVTAYEQFLCGFLGQALRYASANSAPDTLQKELYREEGARISLKHSSSIIQSYCDSYEYDLEVIASMQNVTVIRALAKS